MNDRMSIALHGMGTIKRGYGFRPEPVSVDLEAGFVELGPSAAGIRSINGDLMVDRHCFEAVGAWECVRMGTYTEVSPDSSRWR